MTATVVRARKDPSSRLNHATAWLSLVTGVVTLLAGVLGFLAVRVGDQKSEAQSTASRLKQQNGELQRQLDQTAEQVAQLKTQLDEAKKQPSAPSVGTVTDTANAVPTDAAALADPARDFVTASNGIGSKPNVKMNGQTYTYAFTGCWMGCTNATVDLDLSKQYRTFSATIGMTDDSSVGKRATVQVIGDDRTLITKRVQLGTSYKVTASVAGVLRLRIVASNDGGGRIAIGDPTVTP